MRLASVLAHIFGLGAVPRGQGALASILGLALASGAYHAGGTWAVLGLGLALLAAGVWACDTLLDTAAGGAGVDPARLVIRDLAGQVLTLAAVPMTPAGLLIGFGAFQVFALARPWPSLARPLRLSRGSAVMLDGALSAVAAAAIVGFMTWALGTA